MKAEQVLPRHSLAFVSLLALSACGSDSHPVDDGSNDAGPAPSCELDALLDERLAEIEAVDCGELALEASMAERTTARDCVLNAVAAEEPVRLIYTLQGIDSHVAYAYLVDGSGKASVLGYDGDPSGGSGVGARVSEQHCASLSLEADCTPSTHGACLICDTPSDYVVVCDEDNR